MNLINIKKNRGFVILFAVTLSSIVLAIALGVTNIALKEIKFGTSARETNNAFFAADTGIECALLNDKSGGSLFVSPGSPSLNCSNTSISTTENPAGFWTFVIPGIGENTQSCVRVTVDKTASPVTTVTSRGYNIGDASCLSTNRDRIERELQTTYVGGGVPTPPAPPTSHFTVDTGGTLDTNLAAYWKLDEAIAMGNRTDSVGGLVLTNNNGVGQVVGEKIGSSSSFFAASSQFLSTSSNVTQVGDSSFTFAGWFYLNTTANTVMGFAKDGGVAGQREYRLRFQNSSRQLDFAVFRPGDAQVTVTSSTVLSPVTWYFVVVWHDAALDTLNISVNNGPTNSISTGGSLQTTSNASLFTLGSRQFPGSQQYWGGRIDEFGFWNRVLTAQERTDLYNGGTGNTYNP